MKKNTVKLLLETISSMINEEVLAIKETGIKNVVIVTLISGGEILLNTSTTETFKTYEEGKIKILKHFKKSESVLVKDASKNNYYIIDINDTNCTKRFRAENWWEYDSNPEIICYEYERSAIGRVCKMVNGHGNSTDGFLDEPLLLDECPSLKMLRSADNPDQANIIFTSDKIILTILREVKDAWTYSGVTNCLGIKDCWGKKTILFIDNTGGIQLEIESLSEEDEPHPIEGFKNIVQIGKLLINTKNFDTIDNCSQEEDIQVYDNSCLATIKRHNYYILADMETMKVLGYGINPDEIYNYTEVKNINVFQTNSCPKGYVRIYNKKTKILTDPVPEKDIWIKDGKLVLNSDKEL